jgi:maltose alpha-D-glucosyltransferase/alpha-amylase
MSEPITTDKLWYKDAVIYELHVRSFLDSNGDGMGDFAGLTSRLDYLQDVGVNAIWVLPFYPSPWRDDGYDISDYTRIHPAYGTLKDFKRFLREAHKRDLRVITELVINHTSNQHPWFERARRANPGTKAREYYVWSDTPNKYTEARIIFQDFESSNWSWDPVAGAYYWHRFYSHQPDLNFDNPDVQQEVFRLLDYWFKMGVDGMRLDAVPYLFERENTNCENLPETHDFLKKLRAHVDRNYEDKMLLAEANQWPEDAVPYFGDGDECHMAFHFPIMPRLFMSVKMEDRFPVTDILEQTPPIPENAQWGIFLRNHDELTLEMVTDEERDYMYQAYGRDPRHRINLGIRRRLAPLLENNRRQIELLNILLFSLPGTPVIYYGDEIGMGDNVYLGDRDGVRTPMQWSSDKNAGFSATNPQRLYLPVIIDPEYHYEAVNIENQQANPSSLLWWMKRVLATRRRFKAFSRGDLQVVSSDNAHVFSFVRRYHEESILVVANFSRHAQVVELDLGGYEGYLPEEVFSQNEFPRIKGDGHYVLNIGSYDYYWFTVKPAPEMVGGEGAGGMPEVAIQAREWKGFSDELQKRLEQEALTPYIRNARWFREKSLRLRRISITDRIQVGTGEELAWLLVCHISFANERAETYVVPMAYALREAAEQLRDEHPAAIIANLKLSGVEGVLYDAVYSETFRENLLAFMTGRRKLKGLAGELTVSRNKNAKRAGAEADGVITSRVMKAEQSNTSILYRERFFFKLYRKLEAGLNPDAELVRLLSEERKFPHVPDFAAHLEYAKGGSSPASLGMLVNYIPNEGDAWQYTASSLERYFENLLSRKGELGTPPAAPGSPFDVHIDSVPEWFLELIDTFYLDMVKLLGQRTGELHLALARDSRDAALAPEPFSKLYQRSVYQSLRSLLRRVMSTVNRAGAAVPENAQADLERLKSAENDILELFARVTRGRIGAEKIRIHGDYHLGQVLFTGRDFVIIDLEGEPARSLSERRLKYCSFRDIAGMMRSFHYAVYSKYLQYAEVRPEDAEFLGEWIDPWYHHVSGLFLNSYLETLGEVDFVPNTREELETLLDLFLLEKAIYEVGYEINNRPAWLRIPARGIAEIIDRAKESG